MRVKKNLLGKQFGKLLVVGPAESIQTTSRTYTCWVVRCDCGVEKVVRTANLLNNFVKSCGCMRNRMPPQGYGGCKRPLPQGRASRNAVFQRYIKQAKRRGYCWELSEVEFDSLVSSECHYCGATPNNSIQYGCTSRFVYMGIDRKDNSCGYTPENVVPCCKICNRAKSDMGYSEFLAHIDRIAKKHNSGF